ncbi:MAG: sulfotransferase domain-containing protein [Planctomycetes bacterium]|nr:sulfotransferase domain-containing protein [Planctomycetota bacterium]
MNPADPVSCTADFIVIGAMKCGTTSLFGYLRNHPDICISKPKEPHYFSLPDNFDGKWGHGPAWYASLFRKPSLLKGEGSTGYTKFPIDPEVSDRIHAVNPRVKLIYLMRNPADRSSSHYLHNVIAGRESRSPREALLQDEQSTYLSTSRYPLQLGRYLRLFPRSQFLLETAESLRGRPEEVVNKVLEFLEVRPFPGALKLDRERNVTAVRGSDPQRPDGEAPTPIQLQLSEAIGRCRQRREGEPGAGEILAEFGFSGKDRACLESLFSRDMDEVQSLLGRSVPEWASPGRED